MRQGDITPDAQDGLRHGVEGMTEAKAPADVLERFEAWLASPTTQCYGFTQPTGDEKRWKVTLISHDGDLVICRRMPTLREALEAALDVAEQVGK